MIDSVSNDQVSTNTADNLTTNTTLPPLPWPPSWSAPTPPPPSPSWPPPTPPPDLGKFPYPDSSYIPTEIWESIIDFCYDAPTLYIDSTSKFPHRTWYSCTTTCRSWYHRSRLRLYQTILIISSNQLKRLANCLRLNLRNTEYVLALQIQSDSHAQEWAHYLTPLLLGSLHFPNLKELAFTKSEHNFVSYTAPTMWLKIGRESHNLFIPSWSRFRGSIRILKITDVESSCFVAFTRLVLAFSKIEELDVGRFHAFPRDSSVRGQYKTLPMLTVVQAKKKGLRLKVFRGGFSVPGKLVCRWLLASGSFVGLEKLRLSNVSCREKEEVERLHAILRVGRETIEELSLGLSICIDEHSVKPGQKKKEIIPISLNDLSNLHTLSLLESPTIYNTSQPTVSWLITALSSISSKLLTSLTFRVYLWDFIVKDWDALDVLLTSKQFANLEYVKVKAYRIFDAGKGINVGEAVDSEGRTLMVKEEGEKGFGFLLKRFEAKGKVEVTLEDYDDDPDL